MSRRIQNFRFSHFGTLLLPPVPADKLPTDMSPLPILSGFSDLGGSVFVLVLAMALLWFFFCFERLVASATSPHVFFWGLEPCMVGGGYRREQEVRERKSP